MVDIVLYMRDGSKIEHLHEGRPGGSYSKSIEYKPGFVVVKDEYGKKISYPSSDIKTIEERPIR